MPVCMGVKYTKRICTGDPWDQKVSALAPILQVGKLRLWSWLRLSYQKPQCRLKQQLFISHGLGGWTSKTTVMADWVPGESLLPGLQSTFWPCVHMAETESLVSSSYRDTKPIVRAPPS